MGAIEKPVCESACVCGKGKFTVSYRVPDQHREGIEHLWEIDCIHCRELYKIEKRGKLIGVIRKDREEKRSWLKKFLPKPKFIKILHKL